MADTCNALYWGLMNGRLTPEEFQQHYYSLMMIVFFSPAAFQGPKPPGAMDLESVIKLVSLDQLDLSEYPEKSRAEMNLFKNRLGSPDFFEISFPDGFRERLAGMREGVLDQDPGSPGCSQEEFFMSLLGSEGDASETWLTIKQDKIVIGTLPLMQQMIQPVDESIEPVVLKLVFGSPSLDQIKEMRAGGQYLVPLWHPAVDDSVIECNGIWLGTFSVAYSLFKAGILNKISQERRQEFLWLDTEITVSRRDFYQRVLSDQATEQDRFFLQEFSKILVDRTQTRHGRSRFNFLSHYGEKKLVTHCSEEDGEIKLRPLIDQLCSYAELISLYRNILLQSDLSLSESKYDTLCARVIVKKELIHHFFLFHVVINDDSKLAQKILGIEVRKYPEVREHLIRDRNNETRVEYEVRRASYLRKNPKAGIQLDMTYWVEALSNIKISSQ